MKGEQIAIDVCINGEKISHVAKRLGITSPACSAAMHRYLRKKNETLYDSLRHTSEYLYHTNYNCLPYLKELRANIKGFIEQ